MDYVESLTFFQKAAGTLTTAIDGHAYRAALLWQLRTSNSESVGMADAFVLSLTHMAEKSPFRKFRW